MLILMLQNGTSETNGWCYCSYINVLYSLYSILSMGVEGTELQWCIQMGSRKMWVEKKCSVPKQPEPYCELPFSNRHSCSEKEQNARQHLGAMLSIAPDPLPPRPCLSVRLTFVGMSVTVHEMLGFSIFWGRPTVELWRWGAAEDHESSWSWMNFSPKSCNSYKV